MNYGIKVSCVISPELLHPFRLMAVLNNSGVFLHINVEEHQYMETCKTNLLVPEDIGFILSKSDVNQCRYYQVISVTAILMECRQTDRWLFRL